MSQSLLTRLFPSRQAWLDQTARRTAPTRLGLTSLDDRSLPSVTAVDSPAGVLAITGDATNGDVLVMDSVVSQAAP